MFLFTGISDHRKRRLRVEGLCNRRRCISLLYYGTSSEDDHRLLCCKLCAGFNLLKNCSMPASNWESSSEQWTGDDSSSLWIIRDFCLQSDGKATLFKFCYLARALQILIMEIVFIGLICGSNSIKFASKYQSFHFS